MNKKFIFCFIWLQCSVVVPKFQNFIEQNFSKIHLSKFPIFRLYADESIGFKNDVAYQNVIDTRKKKITLGFEKFFASLFKESEITPEELYEQFYDEKIVSSYHVLKDAERGSMHEAIFIEEQEADPEIIAFIKMILFRYTTKRNLKIVLTDGIAQATASYGSDLYGHTVLCNIHVYTKENIAKYYEALQGGYSIRYDILPDRSVRWMEVSSFLTLRLIFIASWVQHQTDLFVYVLDRCLQRQMISYETINLGVMLQKFLNILSAVFQSTNPLESALFVLKSELDSGSNKSIKLWKLLVQGLAESYSDRSLLKFQNFDQKIKQESKK